MSYRGDLHVCGTLDYGRGFCANCRTPIGNICFIDEKTGKRYCGRCSEFATVYRDNPNPVEVKDPYNPKDAVGVRKWRQYTTIPTTVIWGLGVAMLEGARKYGRHNYRAAPVRASIYVDAAKGHIDQYWEGEDVDKDSKLHHVLKAIASLAVLYDAIETGHCIDDRPPKIDLDAFREKMQAAVDDIFERHPEAQPAFTEKEEDHA
jgi:hypothetical protein